MNFEIRELDESHLNKLLALYRYLHEDDKALPAAAEVEEIWRDVMADDKLTYFGAFESGELVASCTISIIPNFTRGCSPYALIENVVTHASFRRQGLGKAVLEKAIDLAWEAGCYKVMLMTGRLDEATFKFYEAVGFDRHAKQAFVIKPK